MATILTSTLTCPKCGIATNETMPTNACIWFYECTACGVLMRPKHGDCCVFCSYGTVQCPPRQEGDCCAPSDFGHPVRLVLGSRSGHL